MKVTLGLTDRLRDKLMDRCRWRQQPAVQPSGTPAWMVGCLFNAEFYPKRFRLGRRSQKVGQKREIIPNGMLSPLE